MSFSLHAECERVQVETAGMLVRGDERRMSRQQLKYSVEVQDSKHNPNMEIQRSVLGVCSVHKAIRVHPAHNVVSLNGDGVDSWDGGGPEGVRILCLDGGGMKVNLGSMALQYFLDEHFRKLLLLLKLTTQDSIAVNSM